MSETKDKLTWDNRSIILLIFLMAAGFAGNLLALRLFTGFNYLFGSIAALLTVRLFGLRWGLMVALISSSWTIELFGHPYAMIWLCAEVLFVGYLLRRGSTKNMILYDALFWPLLGVPLIWIFFQYVMHVPMLGTVAAALMYWVIGITNTLVASLLMSLSPRILGNGPDKTISTVPIHTMIFNLMMATIAIPAVIIMVIHGRDVDQRIFHELYDGLEDSSLIATYETRLWMQQRPATLSGPEFIQHNANSIQRALRSVLDNEHYTITILDENSKILASTDETRPTMSTFAPCQDGQLTGSGTGSINRCMPHPSSPVPAWLRSQTSTYSLASVLSSELPWTVIVEVPFADSQKKLFKEQINSLLLVLVLNLLTLLTSLVTSHRLSAPLQRISLLTSAMPEQLERESGFSWPSSMITEINQLITNFKAMTNSLGQKFREIADANETLELRVEARARELTRTNDELEKEIAGHRQTEKQLDRLMNELQSKNKELEEIIYVASHDLRSPLINVQGFSRKLAKDCAEIDRNITTKQHDEQEKAHLHLILREQIPKSVEFIVGSIEKMDNLLTGLLRVSRLGRLAINYETLDIQTIMSKIVASMTYQIEAAGAQIETGQLAPCIADAVQLNQVFSNVLDNAIKYRSPDRQLIVRISSEQTAEGVRYCFADNGIGIPAEHRDKIWEIFHRINCNDAAGEGLGLTIARRIVDRLGGSTSVESDPETGSRFFVTLPAPPLQKNDQTEHAPKLNNQSDYLT